MPSSAQPPLITVIVPVYNVADYLSRCLESIVAQTYHNLEIILVDDGSTDQSAVICQEFCQRDRRFKYLHQENAGLSAARNAALKIAKGKYITFVDSDDTIAPGLVTTLYAVLSANRIKLAACTFQEVYPDGHTHNFCRPSSEVHLLSTEECLAEMLIEHSLSLAACGKLYQRELFRTVQYPVGKLYEDVGTTYRLVFQCEQVAFIPQPLYHYYQHPASIIHQAYTPQKLDLITLTNQMCDAIDQRFPALKNLTRLRRLRARVGVLRQKVKSVAHRVRHR